MFKKFKEWFSQLEFSQKLCIWVMSFYGFFMLLLVSFYVFIDHTLPIVDIFDKTILIPTIELGTFGGKTAAENIQKIIKAKAESLLKITTDAGCVVPPTPTETSTTTTTTTTPV
jgi:hypothetical protein